MSLARFPLNDSSFLLHLPLPLILPLVHLFLQLPHPHILLFHLPLLSYLLLIPLPLLPPLLLHFPPLVSLFPPLFLFFPPLIYLLFPLYPVPILPDMFLPPLLLMFLLQLGPYLQFRFHLLESIGVLDDGLFPLPELQSQLSPQFLL